MKTTRDESEAKLLKLSYFLYAGLLFTELAVKALAVYGMFSGHKVTSSIVSRAGTGLWMLISHLVLYAIKVSAIYSVFAILNAHFVLSLTRWLSQKRPHWGPFKDILAFLSVHLSFLAIVYAINAYYYPTSALASGMPGFIKEGTGHTVIGTVLMGMLAFYAVVFILFLLNLRRKILAWAAISLVALLLLASLDPVHLAKGLFPHRAANRNKGPNVVFIGLDSLNPLHTGYSGYPLPISPNLDAFLEKSLYFKNTYTPIARTFPAWYSILTGQYPKSSGVRLNLQKRKYIRSKDQCLGHALGREGYKTLHFTDEVRFSNIAAEDGFDHLAHPPMGILDFVFGSIHDFSLTNVFFNNPLGYGIFPFLKNNRAVSHLYDGRYLLNSIEDTIATLINEENFFLTVHLCLAHWPYFHASPHTFESVPGADPQMSFYDSAVFKVDQQLGRILGALHRYGLYDNSIIVVLSDHGESVEGHGSDLKESEQNRTLLAWKPTENLPHREIDTLVRTIDIAPTVMDSLGFPLHGMNCDGASLRPLFTTSTQSEEARDESVFMETEFSLDTPGGIGLAVQSMIEQGIDFYEFDKTGLITVRDEYHDILIRRRNRAILTPEWKLIAEVLVRGEKERFHFSLFDIRKDPSCTHDVADEHPDIYSYFSNRMRSYYGPEIAGK